MNFIKKIITLLLVFVLLGSSLSARVVEIWPGANKLGYFRLANDPNLKLMFNGINKNNKAYPLQTDLTHRLVKINLLSTTSTLTYNMIKQSITSIENIQYYYEQANDILDPIKATMYLLKKIIKLKGGNSAEISLKENALESLLKEISEVLVAFVEDSHGDLKKALSLGLLSKLNTTITKSFLKDYPLASFIVEKSIENSLEFLFEYSINGNAKYLFEKVGERLVSGILAYMDLANNISNLSFLISSIKSTQSKTKKILIAELINRFMFDYVYKYNMNIATMAKDSKFIFRNTLGFTKSKVPYTFNKVFIFYLMTHNKQGRCEYKNSYLGKAIVPNDKGNLISHFFGSLIGANDTRIRYWDKNDLKLLTLAARDTLDLIEQYGNGGNKKIFLDISNDNIKIDSNSYKILSYYWMPEREFLDTVNYFLAANNYFLNTKNGLTDTILSPFERGTIAQSRKHIDVEYKLEKYKYYFYGNIEKVINYKGFASYYVKNANDYRLRLYKKKDVISYKNFYALRYDSIISELNYSNYLNKIIKKYLKRGIINYYDVVNKNFLNKTININEFKHMLLTYAKVSRIFNVRDIQDAINIVNQQKYSLSLVKRKDAFKVFSFLCLKSKSPLAILLSSCSLSYNQEQKEVCIMKKSGISNGEDGEEYLRYSHLLIMLYRLENTLEKSRS